MKLKGLKTSKNRIIEETEGVPGQRVNVKLVEPQTIERSAGKAKAVIDKIRIRNENQRNFPFSRERLQRAGRWFEPPGEAEINIRALSHSDISDFGILRIIVSDVERAREMLAEKHYAVLKSGTIAVEKEDTPDGAVAPVRHVVVRAGESKAHPGAGREE